MKTSTWTVIVLLTLLVTFRSYAPPAHSCPPCALEVRVNVFEQPGKVIFDQVPNAELYWIEWAPSADGPWTNFTGGMGAWLDNIPAAGVGAITASVPMFYRVRAWVPTNQPPPAPAGMSLIPAGEFVMGDTFIEGSGEELPLHTNTISAFYMDQYEVTKALWDEVSAWAVTNGYSFGSAGPGKATNHPVHSVDWYDAIAWCNARSEREGLPPCYTNANGTVYKLASGNSFEGGCNWSANGYRLPTEAEWEKAARGGVAAQRFPWGDTITHSNANYYSSSSYAYDTSSTRDYHPTFNDGNQPYTSPVGYFAPNGYGLYDMAGNVLEWCWDWYNGSYYSSSPTTDPRGPSSGSYRVLRGGSSLYNALNSRVASRDYDGPDLEYGGLGFRCARGL